MFVWTEESAAFWEDSAAYTNSYDLLGEKAAAHLAPGGTVFEGGCGLGHLSLALAARGFAVTAMDIDPLPLWYLQEHVRQAKLPLDIRQGDAFALPPAAVWDSAVFCFFGGVDEILRWARLHCRDRLIVFKKNWSTHRFTRDSAAIRKFTYPLTVAALSALDVPFEAHVFDVDMGQPFRSLSDAVRFFRLYDPEGAMDEREVRARLIETGDARFPFFLPVMRPVGMISISMDDLRNTSIPEEVTP